MEVIKVDVPFTGDRYLKMFWTARRIAPTGILWKFSTTYDRNTAETYLRHRFKYAAEIEVKREGKTELLMVFVSKTEAVSAM